ncbi:MAG: hypothetical protein V2I43_07105 [Parvularcula sp.]|nr:hypothetical protein [Parvularcula sp.]
MDRLLDANEPFGGPVDDDPFLDEPSLGSGLTLKEWARVIVTDPVTGLCFLVAGAFALDRGLHSTGLAFGAPLIVLAFGTLVIAGLLLQQAQGRYLYARTKALALGLAVLPAAYFLGSDHRPPEPAIRFAEASEVERLEIHVAELQRRNRELTAALSAQGESSQALLSQHARAIEAVLLQLEGEAEDVPAEEPAPEEIVAETPLTMDEALEGPPLDARLAAIGPRIAAAAPKPERQVAALPSRVDSDTFLLAAHIGADDRLRGRMMRDEDLQQCLAERRDERSVLQRMNHSLNRARYMDYLTPCVPGPMLAMVGEGEAN